MIDYGYFQFAALPGTAHGRFAELMYLTGIRGNGGSAGVPFALDPIRHEGNKLRVSLVRNPADWLWDWSMSPSWLPIDNPLTTLRDRMLPEGFLRHYLQEAPGAVGELFLSLQADSYLRIEDLPAALIELLASLGHTVKHLPHVTLPKMPTDHPLRAKILQAERTMCEAFDYY